MDFSKDSCQTTHVLDHILFSVSYFGMHLEKLEVNIWLDSIQKMERRHEVIVHCPLILCIVSEVDVILNGEHRTQIMSQTNMKYSISSLDIS